MEWHQLACGIHEATRSMERCPVCERADAELTEELSMPAMSRWSPKRELAAVRPYTHRTKEENMGTFKFDEESRRMAVARVLAGESASAVAAELGVSGASVRNWLKAVESKPASAPKKARLPVEKSGSRSSPRKAKAQAAEREDALGGTTAPRRSTVADPAPFAHEDVIAFLAKLPPMPWVLGDAIRLLAFHAIDGDRDDVINARERIDAHLLACGEAR